MGFENKFQNKIKLWKIISIFSVVLFLGISSFSINYIFITSGVTRDFANIIFNKKNIKEEVLIKKDVDKEIVEKEETVVCANCLRRKIDGIFVDEKKSNLPQIAVMIDNHFNARPAYGIDKANLVYEAEVEGNFTRYMAIFDADSDINKIGPVRSARPYFIDWVAEFDALYIHCGGSPQALVQIIKEDINDLNEFYNGSYYWRSSNKKAPHNILTSTKNLRKYLEKKTLTPDFLSWKYKDDNFKGVAKNPEIKINFYHDSFKVSWNYDLINNNYIRSLGGELHSTFDGESINAKNIIIQKIPAKVVDDKLRLAMNPVGNGEAIICLDGKCFDANWEKNAKKGRTKFYHPDKKEVEFNPGTTWIEIIKPEIKIEY